MNEAFQYSDPNMIVDIFVNEMEIIQNSLAPPKRVQIRNNLAPWYDKKLQDYSSYKEDIHKMAVINDDIESWGLFKKTRNIYNRMVKEAKSAYYNKKLNIHNYDNDKGSQGSNGSKKMWSMVKKLSGKLSIQPPRKLVVEGKVITFVKSLI